MKYYIANWKANKNIDEAIQWIQEFIHLLPEVSNNTKIILCPPSPLIATVSEFIKKNATHISLGSQDISQFPAGSYTGEIAGHELKNLVEYVIIGHSERRTYFHETDDILKEKVIQAVTNHLEPIYCIRNENDTIPEDIKIVAYEPPSAIGSGNNEDPKKVIEMKNKLALSPNGIFLYGGSVNSMNISAYNQTSQIDGFLVGSKSLDPQEFFKIVSSA